MALVFRMGLITFLFTWIESEAARLLRIRRFVRLRVLGERDRCNTMAGDFAAREERKKEGTFAILAPY